MGGSGKPVLSKFLMYVSILGLWKKTVGGGSIKSAWENIMWVSMGDGGIKKGV